MELTRLNPVMLITGAASGIGAACARHFAQRAQGGLILIDTDEAALSAAADEIEAPERVSTLAFNVADADRWAQASDFIHSQYGRLDWAILSADSGQMPAGAATDLVEWGRLTPPNLDGAFFTLRTAMPLIGANLQGGSIVVAASPGASNADAKSGLPQLVRVAAKQGGEDNIRVNGIIPAGAENAAWSKAPQFDDLVTETGNERAAFDKLSNQPALLARYGGDGDVMRLITMLLADETPCTGATLIVDGGYSL